MTHKKQLLAYSFSHFAVDFACFFILMKSFYSNISDVSLLATGGLIYNFIAFALQVPIGLIADKLKIKHFFISIFGCLIIVTSLLFSIKPFIWTAVILCALGNAFFHIGGGIDSLVNAGGKFARSGIYISFGAIGVALGTVSGNIWLLPVWIVMLLVIVCILMQYLLCKNSESSYTTQFSFEQSVIKKAQLIIFVALLAVFIRAVVGAYISIDWKTTAFLMILPAIFVFLGKFIGGILADFFGVRKIIIVSLILSMPLLTFFSHNIILCCLGLLFFNVTTAVTVCVVASKMPNNPAFAFGLTTFALFIGTAFSLFVFISSNIMPYLLMIFIFIAILCMILSTPNKRRDKK